MPILWRLVKARYSHHAFDGEGARLYGGRWSSPGVVVAYAAESAALAVLEVLVHLRNAETLRSYSFVTADVPDDLVEVFPDEKLPANWRQYPPPPDVQLIGDKWIHQRRSAVLRVPSVILNWSSNYLLNPAHSDFARVEIGAAVKFEIDARLLRPE